MDITENIINKNIRYDLEIISEMIKPKSKVLDIGCGNGELLHFLKMQKNIDGRGLEISQEKLTEAMKGGISVIHGNADNDLSYYPDDSFDYAILSQTMQATNNPKKILQEMLRIANFAIISFPNFAYFQNRLHLAIKGTMPVNKNIPFQWFNTPNIHFCSIIDFEKLCQDLDFTIKKRLFLTNKKLLNKILSTQYLANLFAQYGIFLITKNQLCLTGEEVLVEEFSNNNLNNQILSPSPLNNIKQ